MVAHKGILSSILGVGVQKCCAPANCIIKRLGAVVFQDRQTWAQWITYERPRMIGINTLSDILTLNIYHVGIAVHLYLISYIHNETNIEWENLNAI